MNLILFEEPFESVRLEAGDPRAQHLCKVLQVEVGALVFVGFVNGPRARAEVAMKGADGSFELRVIAAEPAPELMPITLLIGLPRPHTARRILFEGASLGVREMHFFTADHSEPSYAKSRLWRTDEWRERILRGTEQAFGTHLPEVTLHKDIQSALAAQKNGTMRVALDNYEAANGLATILPENSNSVALAVGPERGWSTAERTIFRESRWELAHLGPNVMRLETACVAAVATIASKLNLWKNQTKTVL